MDMKQRWKAHGAAFACAASLAVGSAAAEGPPGVAQHPGQRSVVVRVDDLNQASDAGTHALYSRLRHATRYVCGTPERDLRQAAAIRACRTRALEDAVTGANLPRLTALHESRTGQRPPQYVASRVATAG